MDGKLSKFRWSGNNDYKVNDKISLRMIYDDLWLYYLLVGLGLSKQEIVDAEHEIKEAILNCLKENLKI